MSINDTGCTIPYMSKQRKRPAGVPRPAEIRGIREALGLTVEQAAARIGVKPRTWLYWELPKQQRWPSASHLILIRLLQDGTLLK